MRGPVWGSLYLRNYFISLVFTYDSLSVYWFLLVWRTILPRKSNEVLSYIRKHFEDFIRAVFFKVHPFIIF